MGFKGTAAAGGTGAKGYHRGFGSKHCDLMGHSLSHEDLGDVIVKVANGLTK